MHDSELLFQIVLLLAVSVPVVVLFRRLNLPSLSGFLVVGALVGPHALGWVHDVESVEALAEIGVALLLFTVGIELSVPRLLLMKRRILIGGGGQMLLTIVVVAGLFLALGVDARLALLAGGLASLSSTALVLKDLADEHEYDTPHGQFQVAVLLFQDLAVIPLMLAVPMLSGAEAPGLSGILLVLSKAVLAVCVVLLVARYGFSKLAYFVVKHGGRELFTLAIVMVALGAAWVTQALGMPLALGAFVAGLVISESEYSHHVVSEIVPFRDVFSALFFLSVGMLFNASMIIDRPLPIFGLTVALFAVKAGIVAALAWWLSRSRRVALLSGIGLFQIGELSFVVAAEAFSLQVMDQDAVRLFVAVAVLSLLVSPFVTRFSRSVARRVPEAEGPGGDAEEGGPEPPVDVLIAGYGLNGQHLSRVLRAAGITYRVLEMNPEAVRKWQAVGVPIQFADVARAESLEHCGLKTAKVFVIAISDASATRRAVVLARRLAPGVCIIVRTRFLAETEELLRLGASQVIPEDFETSVEIFGRVLREMHVPRGTIAVQMETIRREGYQLLRAPDSEQPDLELIGQILAETAVDTSYVSRNSPACGRSMKELDLRARGGAWIVSVARHGEAVQAPGPDFVLQPGDLAILIGEHAEIEVSRKILEGRPLEDD